MSPEAASSLFIDRADAGARLGARTRELTWSERSC